ncbi:hypothetical protein MUG87_01295 [Ectobacillus sp. JY-23]|uniref:hypothetical protein n=1 Tax=Ectobacillus sp. JY-23 TaxID=2933872 RepID=UPI001FF2FED1|nr:hypothetical protein [Ectobacillus sp. JY-23]UOY92810.1 hypothetical protein MUG87_01295 [Ectobacillus sp. JY-23]
MRQLQHAVKQLLQAEKPIRITKTRLMKMAQTPYALRFPLYHLPKTEVYLQTVGETVITFQIRRIQWAATEIAKSNRDVTPFAIRVKASFLDPKRMSGVVWKEIHRQVDRFAQSNAQIVCEKGRKCSVGKSSNCRHITERRRI